MKKYKAVVFDFDGTLSNRQISAYNKYKDDLQQIFPDINTESFEFEAIIQSCLTWDQFGTIKRSYVFDQLGKTYNLDQLLMEKMSKKWSGEFYKYTILREGVFETLEKLGKDYKLGCITNGDSNGQHSKLDYCGIKEVLDAVIVSGDLGFHKPDPKIFIEISKMLDVLPEEIIYVGDTFYADIYGATLAGCTPIWLITDKDRPCGLKVNRVDKFPDLINVINEIEESR
jgi:putative hydrolase of the HAD superfamily